MLLYIITLGGISSHAFPVITWIHSSVSSVFYSFCTLLHFFDHYKASIFTELYHYLSLKWRLSSQSSSLRKTGLAVFSWLPHFTYTSHFFWCYCLISSFKILPQLGSYLFIQALYITLKSLLSWKNFNYSSFYPYHIWNILNNTNTVQISTGFYRSAQI